jgi:methylglyoxal synthase
MVQFCIAYCGILSKHNICATATTGKLVADTTGLNVVRFMNGKGGVQQIASRISYNEIDLLLNFKDTRSSSSYNEEEAEMMRMCDLHNIPVATNIATAEILVQALDRGDLNWREVYNPRSEYNRKRNGLI